MRETTTHGPSEADTGARMSQEDRPQKDEFSDFYDRGIVAAVEGAERQRRKFVRIGLAFVIGGCLLPLFGVAAPIDSVLLRIALMFSFLPAWITAWYFFSKAKLMAKQFLIHRLCAHFHLDYSWGANDFPFRWFEHLHFIPDHDRFAIEDYVTGEHEGVTIHVCDAHLEEAYKITGSDTDDKATWHKTVFRGLLCCFSFPKEFSGRTIVTGDRGGIGNWLAKLSMTGDPVHLEDPRFEGRFAVYSTDQIEARYLLTPGFMERLLEFAGYAGPSQLRLAFDGNHIFVALNEGRDFFEVRSAFRKVSDTAQASRLYDEFRLIFYMIEILGLSLKTRV